ncbi:LPS export ABC transporter permease LptF [Niveispirillum sp.]|uniref:LPS export ABC transporter permease LptF n=1 Tax=Niveispirillum sp. TaxID=1917217 RepID=UPI001B784BBD|nr:LPS export ABC transporter permease LptF [Niveispirillum sp.]MBP7336080.1 LPS export ABC transporter permease LptF [Niveispirillum sp.]
MMSQINRYLLRNLVLATLVVTGALSAAIWLTQSLRLVELVVEGGAGFGAFAHLAILSFPTFLPVVLPFGVLTAVLFTYNRLTQDSELVVMRAAGLGPMALARPVLILAGLATLLCFVLSVYLGPAAQRSLVAMRQSVRSDMSAALLREGTFNELSDGLTIYVRDRLADGTLQDILIHDSRTEGETTTIAAASGTLTDAEGVPRVLVHDGVQSKFITATGRTEWLEFERYAVDLQSLRRELPPRWVEPRERPLADLWTPNATDPTDRRFAGRLRAELHNRLASPFLVLSFAIIALAALLPGEFSRRGHGRRITIAAVGALVLQAAVLGIVSLIGKVPVLAGLLYLFVLAPVPLGLWYLRRETVVQRPTIGKV